MPAPSEARAQPGENLQSGRQAKGGFMKELWTRFVEDESGQGLVEYVLIIAVVAIGLILALYYFRDRVGQTYVDVSDSLKGQPANEFATP
jgi:Flp pilus assembly pilin Flp